MSDRSWTISVCPDCDALIEQDDGPWACEHRVLAHEGEVVEVVPATVLLARDRAEATVHRQIDRITWLEREVVPAEQLREVLRELVRLKDGPRDDAYRAARDSAWEAARAALRD